MLIYVCTNNYMYVCMYVTMYVTMCVYFVCVYFVCMMHAMRVCIIMYALCI